MNVDRGDRIAIYAHPRPLMRPVTAALAALGLAGMLVGIVGLLVLGIGYRLPLLPLMAIFLAALGVPLLLLTVLHPAVTVYDNGLWLQPLLWRGVWLPWDALSRLEDHTLIRRGTQKDRDVEHFGQLIVVNQGLPPVFAVVGLMSGLGPRTRAFGISTHSQREYHALLREIKRHM